MNKQKYANSMNAISLGDEIRTLRNKLDLSLRELAQRTDISPPHMSDIELGKRYPSDTLLHKLAQQLKTSFDELKKYDNRNAVSDIRRIMEANPVVGVALRSATEKFRSGELTADELAKRLNGDKRKS